VSVEYIDIHYFNVLKYTKKYFKVSTSIYFESITENNTKKIKRESELILKSRGGKDYCRFINYPIMETK